MKNGKPVFRVGTLMWYFLELFTLRLQGFLKTSTVTLRSGFSKHMLSIYSVY